MTEDENESREGIKSWTVQTPNRTVVIEVWERLSGPLSARSKKGWALLFVVYMAVYWIFVATTIVFDPFGAGEVSSRYSQDLLNRILGIEYPGLFQTAEVTEDTKVSVVLLTDSAAEILSIGDEPEWPLPARVHASVLQAILTYEPKAVMVDMLLIDELRGKTGNFKRTLRRYNDHDPPVPLLFAGSTDPQESLVVSDGAAEILAERLRQVPRLPVTEELYELAGELAMVDIVPVGIEPDDDGTLRRYPLRGTFPGRSEATPTAAAALFNLARGPAPSAADEEMTIFWSLDVHKANRRWMECDPTDENWLTRLLTAVFSPSSLRQDCPSIATVPAIEFFEPNMTRDIDIEEMVTGNIVFYGMALRGLDTFVTPTSPRMPGVYAHAMATDNLLRFNGRFLRSETEVSGIRLSSEQANLFVAAPLIAILVAAYLTLFASAARSSIWWRALAVRGLLILVSMLVSLGLATVLLTQFFIAPVNWVALPLLGLPVVAFADNPHLKRPWRALMQRLRPQKPGDEFDRTKNRKGTGDDEKN